MAQKSKSRGGRLASGRRRIARLLLNAATLIVCGMFGCLDYLAISRSTGVLQEAATHTQANHHVFSVPSSSETSTVSDNSQAPVTPTKITVAFETLDDTMVAAPTTARHGSRHLSWSPATSSGLDRVTEGFRQDNGSSGEVATGEESVGGNGADGTSIGQAAGSRGSLKKPGSGRNGRFVAKAIASVYRRRRMRRASHDDKSKSGRDEAVSEEQVGRAWAEGGARAVMKTGLAQTGRFFREVWGLTNHAWALKAQKHRGAREAKVDKCAWWCKDPIAVEISV